MQPWLHDSKCRTLPVWIDATSSAFFFGIAYRFAFDLRGPDLPPVVWRLHDGRQGDPAGRSPSHRREPGLEWRERGRNSGIKNWRYFPRGLTNFASGTETTGWSCSFSPTQSFKFLRIPPFREEKTADTFLYFCIRQFYFETEKVSAIMCHYDQMSL